MHRFIAILAAFCVAVTASPFPQAVTDIVSPSAAAPSGCVASSTESFGIFVVKLATASSSDELATATRFTLPTGNAGKDRAPTETIRLADAADQGTTTIMPVEQITDGQIQQQTASPSTPFTPVSQIGDGQVQATYTPSYTPVTVTSTVVSVDPATQLSDGQPQAETSASLVTSYIVSTTSALVGSSEASATAATVGSAGESTAASSVAPSATATASSGIAKSSCKTNSTLEMTLDNGILHDAAGRTGYIASNFQFQFDSPPQAGAIYTAGWTVCSNGSLSLGGSSVFWQCLSGDFYNLYDRDFGAAQCQPVLFEVVHPEDC